jgi:hypothetical protein
MMSMKIRNFMQKNKTVQHLGYNLCSFQFGNCKQIFVKYPILLVHSKKIIKEF